MTKDLRVTLRITEALDTWLGTEGDKRGLDKAAFARMLLFERMNGTTPNSGTINPKLGTSPPWEETYPDSEPGGLTTAPEPTEMTADAPNVDDMVQTALEDAKTLPEAPQEELEVRGSGVRPVRRPPVPYSKGHPSWIPQ